MKRENHDLSYRALQWTREENDSIDEQAIRWLLLSVVYRNRGELAEAKEELQRVIALDKNALKGPYHDEWMGNTLNIVMKKKKANAIEAPAAHYEKAVCLWKESNKKAGTDGSIEIKALLEKAANWGPYELDARIGLRVQTALDTVNSVSKPIG